jgi:hypothetical protein
MTEEIKEPTNKLIKAKANRVKLAGWGQVPDSPWYDPESIDYFGTPETVTTEGFRKTVDQCRFFYRKDALASAVINKMVELAINDLVITTTGGVARSTIEVYEALKEDLLELLENSMREYLLSGLVLPQVDYKKYTSAELRDKGISNRKSLLLPDIMWLRDPKTILVENVIASGKPSYFLEVPDKLAKFIQNKGVYSTGIEDKALYRLYKKNHPTFVRKVQKFQVGVYPVLILLDDLIFDLRRNYLTDSPYPTPFLSAAVESMEHKRNLKRMDYSIAGRVISAILHFKLGNDVFPLLEGDEDEQVDALLNQMRWRNGDYLKSDIESVYQLVTNHTVDGKWIMPDTAALLDHEKYFGVDADILNALGFPKILLTGETERSGSSDAEIALVSPTKTLEVIRRKMSELLKSVVRDIANKNNFKETPKISLAPLNLYDLRTFIETLIKLYETKNLSREDLQKEFGYDFDDTLEKLVSEKEAMEEAGIDEFAEQAF